MFSFHVMPLQQIVTEVVTFSPQNSVAMVAVVPETIVVVFNQKIRPVNNVIMRLVSL